MNKAKVATLGIALILTFALAVPALAFAAEYTGQDKGVRSTRQAAAASATSACNAGIFYIDANGDGVCDNYSTNGQGAAFVDADGDGVCDNHSTNYSANGQGAAFVDADRDGVCDNTGARQGAGSGGARNGAGSNAGNCGAENGAGSNAGRGCKR